MDERNQIFHDLSNFFLALQKQIGQLAGAEDKVTRYDYWLELKTIHANMEHGVELLQKYRDVLEEQDQKTVETLELETWSRLMQFEQLPRLAALYKVRITFEATLQTKARAVVIPSNADIICENLIANAAAAGATRMRVEMIEGARSVDLIFRDNGRGMSDEQLLYLALGYSSHPGAGHGQGFRIIHQLACDMGALVRPPKSILGVGTEIRLSFMKAGSGLSLGA